MNPPTPPPPSNMYERLAAFLEEASWSLDQRAKAELPETIGNEKAWEQEALRLKDKLDATCKAWSKERGPFPDMPPLEEYFLWVRLFAGVEFLHQLHVPDSKAMIPCPTATDQEMIEWLLVEWWEYAGRNAALYSYSFTFDFSRFGCLNN